MDIALSIVTPVYNSAPALEALFMRLSKTMQDQNISHEIIFVDDCSTDNSWDVMCGLCSSHPNLRILRLGKNVGQWRCTLAGIERAKGQAIATIDDDLEFDPKDIISLYRKLNEENLQIVYGIADNKAQKNLSYKLFYHQRNRLLNRILGKELTESFKVFRRSIYDQDSAFPTLHFEAYAKHVISQKFVGYVQVDYNKSLLKRSRHTFKMKTGIMLKYAWEYWLDPMKPAFFAALLLIMLLISVYFFLSNSVISFYVSGFIFLLLAILIMTILYYVAWSLHTLHLHVKGKPDYLIIDERPKE